MIYQLKAIFRKEWTDMVRDRRTLVAAFGYAVFGPIFLGFFIHFIAGMKDDQKDVILYIAGASHAPGLVEFIQNRDITIRSLDYEMGMEVDPTPAVKQMEDRYGVVLVITPDHQQKLKKYAPADLFLYTNMGVQENMIAVRRINRMVSAYGRQISDLRLISRGVAPSIRQPFNIETGDLSSSGVQGKLIAELMLLYFILAPFFASMAIAIDVTAGERERSSLQVLLAQPVSSYTLMLGKWAVSAAFGFIGTVITVVLGAVILSQSPLGALGIRLELDPFTLVSVILAMIPLVLMVASLQMLIALFAKSFKEAQTYLTMISFAPALVGMMRTLTGSQATGFAAYLPVTADIEVLSGLLRGGSFNFGLWGVATVVTLILAIVFYTLASRLLDSERILGTG